MRSVLFAALVAALLSTASFKAEAADYFTPVEGELSTPVMGETVYVPLYSHVYVLGKTRFLLAATLSIHNTDLERPITITSVRYYNTAGRLMETYLDRPHRLAPLATAEFFIGQNDQRGGSGANFIVEWVAETEVSQPIVEAVMAGVSGPQGLSLIRSGHVIRSLSEPQRP